MELPQLPVPIGQFLKYTNGCTNHSDLSELVKPFKAFESKLREIYAQHPDHPAIEKNHLVPIFSDDALCPAIRARNLDNEPSDLKDRYLLALDDEARRPNGSPAIVKTLPEFRNNFNLFCESSLVDLDWNNVIAAGSSVVTALLPVDAPHNESKRALRAYYHQTLAPASDVDLFLYGLNEEQAIEKIKQIETKIRDSILSETTTIRTKNAITIVSEYPTRHVQIVLRLYKSKSEVLTGFDVDCSCVAYDGRQVWATPRALTAFMTQVNTIDLTRRSPSYENRLSKYSHRGFEVYWSALDRARIDPTIFERSFGRVKGLARLLVLEKLPHPSDRDTYLAKRRVERGRAPVPWNARYRHQLPGNVKDAQPDDVAEWVEEDEVSNYHTFTIPYGPKYNAKKIEKLLFTKDLLLNAEWNRPKDRETKIHRHPAFFGRVEDVIGDCCGFCPKPESDEDLKAFEEESLNYISGDIEFLRDDPGRQAIGSFHPISDEDWTEMAYVGNTTRLCQAIVDKDLEAVEDWFLSGDPEEVLDVNRRDHVGRTPLLLAVMASTPNVVQFLIERGARLVSRLYNGMTALHIAAYNGEIEMIKMLLSKSESNEEAQARKEDAKKAARRSATKPVTEISKADQTANSEEGDDVFSDRGDDYSSDEMTEGSFVKVPDKSIDALEDDLEEPDVYDINVLAWDQPMSPLHLAIIAGKIEVVKLLVKEFGADVLLPVKILGQQPSREPEAAILTLILALEASLHTARETVDTLLSLGATTTQADMKERSALHFAISQAKETIISAMVSKTNADGLTKAINHTSMNNPSWYQSSVDTPLLSAIRTRDPKLACKVLDLGAEPTITYESWSAAYLRSDKNAYIFKMNPDRGPVFYRRSVQQPIILAAKLELPEVVSRLIDAGADINALPKGGWAWLEGNISGEENKSLLDVVRDRIQSLEKSDDDGVKIGRPEPLAADETYLDFPVSSYQHWTATYDLFQAKIVKRTQMKEYDAELKRLEARDEEGVQEKKRLANETLKALRVLETKILSKGGKTFYELHPDAQTVQKRNYRTTYSAIDESSYKTKFSFTDPGLDNKKKEAYLSLFEAAFTGNIETVKNLCLKAKKPLLVGTQDLAGFSPFALSVLRGHYHLAAAILDIATIQFQPSKDEAKYRYCLRNPEADESEDDSEYDSDASGEDSEAPQLLRELVDEKFTVEDITTLADNAKSNISPQDVLECRSGVWRAFAGKPEAAMEEFDLNNENPVYSVYLYSGYGELTSKTSLPWFNQALPFERDRCKQSLVRYAIAKNDMKMLRFLLAAGRKLMARKDDDGDTPKTYTVKDDDFEFALRHGHTELVGEIVKATGHGMPLNKMVATSGVKVEEGPRYYQGLTVHGHKRKDWAEQGRGNPTTLQEDHASPLLKTIFQGNLHSTEYYFSDGPLNRYTEFANAHRDDKRIQGLEDAEGGLNKALGSWLSARSGLAAHMAVMAKPSERGNPLLEYVLKVVPTSLDTKSLNGLTPLHLAFQLGRIESARILIKAGADQGTRDNDGSNILHTIFNWSTLPNPQGFSHLLRLLDKDTVQSLLLQKSYKPEPGSMTPLAVYLQRFSDKKVVRTILDYSQGKDLSIMNSAGDYILHTLVREGKSELVKFLVEYRPEMLWWENATGLTPVDVALVARLRYIVEHPPDLPSTDEYVLARRSPSEFVKKQLSDEEKDMNKDLELDADDLEAAKRRQWYMLHLLQKLAEKFPGERKLVSLFDANEVAKRLAREQRKSNEEIHRQERLGLNAKGIWITNRYGNLGHRPGRRVEMEKKEKDEVEKWLGIAHGYPKADLLRLVPT
ncbi:hypothetical protein DV736_g6555, partial [Chaetothyriales sp. CBS 134916]